MLTYGKAIEGLGWAESQQKLLFQFIIDLYESRYIAHGVVTSLPDGTMGDLHRMVAFAEGEVDREALAALGEAGYREMKLLLALQPFLDRIAQSLDPPLNRAGAPLTPKQVVPLAELIRDVYGPPGSPETLPSRNRVQHASGLTSFDEILLERAATTLSRSQLEVLRSALIDRNRDFILRN